MRQSASAALSRTPPQRVLLRAANWIGDAVMTTPAVRALGEALPAAHITVLAKPWVAPVFAHHPRVDRILIYAAPGRHAPFVGGKLRLAKELRRYRFDAAVVFQNAFEGALIPFLAGIPVRVGFKTDGRHLLLSHGIAVQYAGPGPHQVDYYRGILQGAGWPCPHRRPEIFLAAADRAAARATLKDLGIDDRRPLVALCPGATFGSAKRWPAERFGRIFRRLHRHAGVQGIVLGGPAEDAVGRAIAGAAGPECRNLGGRVPLRTAMALMDRCRLAVTNDSGLMHVAAALDIPLVAVFGPTDPAVTGPRGRNSRVVRETVACAPCLKAECPADHRCMRAVTVDGVWRVILREFGDILTVRHPRRQAAS